MSKVRCFAIVCARDELADCVDHANNQGQRLVHISQNLDGRVSVIFEGDYYYTYPAEVLRERWDKR